MKTEEAEVLRSSEALLTSWKELGVGETIQSLPLSAYGLLMKVLGMDDMDQQRWKAHVVDDDPSLERAASGLLELAGKVFEEEKEEGGRQAYSLIRFDEAITGLDFEALLPLSGDLSMPIVRLLFLGSKDYDRVLLTSDQDIEDTLRLGQAILDVVEEVLRTAGSRGIPMDDLSLGENIVAILSNCEEALASIRRVLSHPMRVNLDQ